MKLGIDVFSTNLKIGLLSSTSAHTSSGEPSFYKLFLKGNLCKLFSAEHGFAGVVGAGDEVEDGKEPRTGLPIYSLYKDAGKELDIALLADLDALVYDIQDVGARYYTYTSTLLVCLKACKMAEKKFIVLDRPNPLGNRIEGFAMQEGFYSFVGAFQAPMRYGLTCGELALYLNRDIGADLQVVPMQGYTPAGYWESTGLAWHKPSPNILDPKACQIYQVTCLLEGLNISEGRGTERPFYTIGSPFIEPEKLMQRLGEWKGIEMKAAHFVPESSKYKGETCHGIEFVLQKDLQAAFPLALRLYYALRELYADKLEHIRSKSGYFLDLLCGNDFLRKGMPLEKALEMAEADSKAFASIQKEMGLYEDNESN